MKAEVTEVATCRKRITIDVPADKVNGIFDEIYQSLAHQVQLKGFRKGHTPRAVLKKRFGAEVASDARMRILQTALGDCLKEKNLIPLGEPDIEKIAELEAKPDTPFRFEAEVDVQPEFEIPQYKGLKLVEKLAPVSDEDVVKQLENFARSFATYEETDEGAKEKDALTVDAVITCNGEELMNVKEQKVYAEGERLFLIRPGDVAKTLAGLKAGDEKKVEGELPDTYHKEELRGKKAALALKVHKVERPLIPSLDDELAQRVGMGTFDALKSRVRENLEAENKRKARMDMEKQATKLLLDSCTFPLPEGFLKKQQDAAIMRSRMQLAQMGASEAFLKEKEADLKESALKETETSIRRTILVGAIADKEKVEITEQDLQMHVQQLAAAYRTTPQEIINTVQKHDGFGAMAAEIRDIKVTKLILDSAEVETRAEAVKDEEE